MKKAIGITVHTPKGDAVVTKRIMTEASKKPSTFYEARLANGDVYIVHENVVHGTLDGTYVPEAPKVKGPRKVSTKKQRAVKHVETFKRQRMSRGEIIKALAKKLRVSRTTAQSYYYQVK